MSLRFREYKIEIAPRHGLHISGSSPNARSHGHDHTSQSVEKIMDQASRTLRIRTVTSVREVEVVSTRPGTAEYNPRNSAERTAIVTPPVQARRHVNGVRLPVEEDRKRHTKTSHNIAAIDFGTTSCSLAYCIKGDTAIHMLKLSADDNRVPSAILVDPNGTVMEFGKNARKKYVHLTSEKKRTHQFFSEIKMKLQHDKVRLYID